MRVPVPAGVLLAALFLSQAVPAAAQPVPPPAGAPSPAAHCRAAISMAERVTGVPDRLMQAIGVIESGRRDEAGLVSAYPWTINAEGIGSHYATKAEAVAAVTALRARGVRSIDVGCMQVNLLHHADAFTSLDEAFDPAANAAYAARFLQRLLAQTGSWPAATAGYHSLTPDIGAEYARKVLAVWAKPAPRGTPAPPVQPISASMAPATGFAAPAASFAAGSAGAGRVLMLPGAVTATGRGLDSYRSAPTRLAFGGLPGRG